MDNKIGTHTFIALIGQVDAPKERLSAPVQRPGVDGTGVRKEATKGRMFQLTSRVDATDLEDGWSRLSDYQELIKEDPVALIKDDHEFDGVDGWKVKVWDVRLRRLGPIIGATGGLNDPSGAWLECVWSLLAVTNP